jgi:hypothetical protein
MKIRPAGAELFNADGRTDRHDEANSRFSHFENAPKNENYLELRLKIKFVPRSKHFPPRPRK